jgi:tetratricopeptide (TPR) repeat protein
MTFRSTGLSPERHLHPSTCRADSLDWLRASLALQMTTPTDADSLYRRGLNAARARNPRLAVELFGQAAAAAPGDAKVRYCEALALHETGELSRALASYRRAIEIAPDYAEAYFGRANVLRAQGSPEAALADYDRAIELRPNYAEACCNRGIVLRDLHRLEEARASLQAAIVLRPELSAGYLNLGNVSNELRDWQAALQAYDRAISLKPDYAEAYCSRAFASLLRGDFASGWRDNEWRWKNANSSNFQERRARRQPLWLGRESVAGRTVLLHSEQGLGDTLQFCRYAALVAQRGAKVILEVQPPLTDLLAQLPDVSQVVARGAPLPDFDFHCPLMSLPLAFETNLHSIPGTARYLSGAAAKISSWRARLGDGTEPRIGLVWSGSATKRNDRHRSLRLAELVPHLPPGLRYVSLQKEVREGDRQVLRETPAILDFSNRLLDFSDTAALCECMDLVLSVDTSVAHLSAALGKPTWILLPFTPDWRWLLDREDSPWYPTARLYRQATPGDWTRVLERARADLTRWPRPPAVPGAS